MVESGTFFKPFSSVLDAIKRIGTDDNTLPFQSLLLGSSRRIPPPQYLLPAPAAGAGPGAPAVAPELPFHPAAGAAAAAAGAAAHTAPDSYNVAGTFPEYRAATGTTQLRLLSDPWPAFEHSMDASQLDALRRCLQQRLAVVVGPPGCGKTYVGVMVRPCLCGSACIVPTSQAGPPNEPC